MYFRKRGVMNLDNFFKAKSIAIIGVSRNPAKIGHVLFRNLLDAGYKGKVFPVNPELKSLFDIKAYKSVLDIKDKLDLAVIAVPAEHVLKVVRECNEKDIKDVLIITAGFRETGNKIAENELKEYLELHSMRCIGVNCLGLIDFYHNLDLIFLPRSRLKRPEPGNISFVTQSGALGSAILDLCSANGYKFSKFISYGNATVIDESDILEYLLKDKTTDVICLYLEGVKDGEKFFKALKKVTRKKPVIVMKGGISDEGNKAAKSHTGALAGKSEVYFGIFKQTNVIIADSLEQMLYYASTFSKISKIKGSKVQIITNGGGYGIITTDAIAAAGNLKLAEMNEKIKNKLKKEVSNELVSFSNPLDLIGDADTERYRKAIESCMKDNNIDAIILIVLYQTPLITTDIIDVISEFSRLKRKPVLVVSTGGNFTRVLKDALNDEDVCTYEFPEHAVKALSALVRYKGSK
ncbi:CoA-binding protein [Candidatus Woesearchaeota archaeon]|nr:CoA-binding protein [Candidatus Woesearchaeota archaeon]